MSTVKVFLRESVKAKNGLHPICLRVTINRSSKLFSLRKYLSVADWAVLRTDKRLAQICAVVSHYESRANTIVHQYELAGRSLSLAIFEKEFLERIPRGENFYLFVEQEIKLRCGSFAPGTEKMLRSQLQKIKDYANELRTDEINFEFCQKYYNWLRFNRGNNINTTNKAIKVLRQFINWAKQKELIHANPAEKIKLRNAYASRISLSVGELSGIFKAFASGDVEKQHENCARIFLFACFTGLRFSDLKNLTWQNVQGLTIVLEQEKTGAPVRIPLHEKAAFILGERGKLGRVFNVPCNQVYNKQLKQLAKYFGLEKRISSHTARHTFACVGLEIGISLKTISDLLGHSSIRITEIYAKMNDNIRESEAAKFNLL